MAGPDLIDLHHKGERLVGSYLLETDDGPALFDCGPSTCTETLKAALADRGLALTDIRHLLLSHVHLDHAGAAGTLVREHPGLRVHVSEIGAPHVIDPSRLEASARRLYGEAFDDLWGEVAPVPAANVDTVGDTVLGLECFPSPGHARHHVCYLHGDGTLYAGDAAGVRIQPARRVLPVCPPPEVDVEAWQRTFDEIERRQPDRLALVHFGVAEDVADHLGRLRQELATWAERAERQDQAEWVEAVHRDLAADVGEEEADRWFSAVPLWLSYAGLRRYWDKRREAEAASGPRTT